MALTLPAAICDLGVFGYLYLNAIQLPNPEALITPERVISLGGVLLAAGFFAGQIWKDFKGSKTKLSSDNDRLNKQREEINALTLQVAKLRWVESSHRRLRDKFYLLLGSLAPVLKDMDVDFSRNGTMGKILASIDIEEPTDDGTH